MHEGKSKSDFGYFIPITTRWMDNDIYGHVNNVVYYSYFDTIANSFLITECAFDLHDGDTVGFVVASSCEYFSPIRFPDDVSGGLRINKIGNRSVEYGIGLFLGDGDEAVAVGKFTHVFVDRQSQKSVEIPPSFKNVFKQYS